VVPGALHSAASTLARTAVGWGRLAVLILAVCLVASGCSALEAAGPLHLDGLATDLGAAVRRTDGAAERPRRKTSRDRPSGSVNDTAASGTGSSSRVVRLQPRPRPGPFSIDLARPGDFVSQRTAYWCVSAASQTMINIVANGRPDRSTAFQRRLHAQGRRLDPDDHRVGGTLLHGLGLTDWAGILNANGVGPYELDRARQRHVAIRKAARALRETGRPVGLVVWRGAHAWVMSGFRATADPAWTNDFRVTRVVIQDVWFPRVSGIWGASRPPSTQVPVSALAGDFLPYNRPSRRHPMRDGKYMLVVPVLAPGTQAR
jgi:hypothetical protein